MERTVLHCDLNNFFASVECLDYPQYREMPVAVCGDAEERHGIVLAKNEEAKKYGVKTAEAIWQAKQKCAQLVVLPPHYDRYVEFSQRVRDIYACYTDKIESFGIDECWLDVTESKNLFGNGFEIAEKLRESVKSKVGLTISVGVSFNKVFAKLASDMKKPDATTVILKDDFKNIVWNLPVSDLLMVGRQTKKRLYNMGIFTIGELARTPVSYLKKNLGKQGETIWLWANGMDDSAVMENGYSPVPKSIGNSTTPDHDLLCYDDVFEVILELAEKIGKRLRSKQLDASVIEIAIRDARTLEWQTHRVTLPYPTHGTNEIINTSAELFKNCGYNWKNPIRSFGIRMGKLEPMDSYIQLSFFQNMDKLRCEDNLYDAIEDVCSKYGKDTIKRARLMKKSTSNNVCSFSYINNRTD